MMNALRCAVVLHCPISDLSIAMNHVEQARIDGSMPTTLQGSSSYRKRVIRRFDG